MTNSEIVELIYKDDRYRSICKRIAKKPLLAEELHSEFTMHLLEVKDERLVIAKAESYLEVYCIGIINKLWARRGRTKIYKTGTTSPLFEYTGIVEDVEFSAIDENYNYKIDYVSKAAEDILRQDMSSPDVEVMYPARVFYYSYSKCFPAIKNERTFELKVDIENPQQYSEHSGIPYTSVIGACNKVKKKLRDKLKKQLYD